MSLNDDGLDFIREKKRERKKGCVVDSCALSYYRLIVQDVENPHELIIINYFVDRIYEWVVFRQLLDIVTTVGSLAIFGEKIKKLYFQELCFSIK